MVQSSALDASVDELVRSLMSGGPHAQAAAKMLIRDVAEKAMSDALMQETAQRIALLRMDAETREGLRAFLDKRSPDWMYEAQ